MINSWNSDPVLLALDCQLRSELIKLMFLKSTYSNEQLGLWVCKEQNSVVFPWSLSKEWLLGAQLSLFKFRVYGCIFAREFCMPSTVLWYGGQVAENRPCSYCWAPRPQWPPADCHLGMGPDSGLEILGRVVSAWCQSPSVDHSTCLTGRAVLHFSVQSPVTHLA